MPRDPDSLRMDWVAVTGMARSGTTFVGDTLALGCSTLYLHEPFSPLGMQGVDWDQEALVGEALTPESGKAREVIESMLRLRGRYGNQVPQTDSWLRQSVKRVLGGRGRVAWRVARLSALWAKRGVLKDPFAWRYCPTLFTRHGVRVVVVIKHPVSQVASYARAGWRGNLNSVVSQAALLDQLEPSDLSLRISSTCSDAIACAREWRWTYRLLGKWAAKYGWLIVRIEDLSDDPHDRFRELFDSLCWDYPKKLDRALTKRTGAKNPAEARKGVFQDLNRNSRLIFGTRRDSVPPEIRRQIFQETFDVASQWYDEASFALERASENPDRR